jgi:hypothetical protein
MTIGIAESLIACGGFDGHHMAGLADDLFTAAAGQRAGVQTP